MIHNPVLMAGVRQRILAVCSEEGYNVGPNDAPPEALMTQTALNVQTPLQRLIVERALALAQEVEATADAAPSGQVIDRCEALLLGAGRDFLRHALEDTLTGPGRGPRKKGRPPGLVPAARRAVTRAGRRGR